MHLSDLNECLVELPEISVLEYFRPRQTAGGMFRWTGEEAIDGGPTDLVGPICVDDRGIEYVLQPSLENATVMKIEICRVIRPNNTVQFRKMTRSRDVPASLREALLDFAESYSWKMAI